MNKYIGFILWCVLTIFCFAMVINGLYYESRMEKIVENNIETFCPKEYRIEINDLYFCNNTQYICDVDKCILLNIGFVTWI